MKFIGAFFVIFFVIARNGPADNEAIACYTERIERYLRKIDLHSSEIASFPVCRQAASQGRYFLFTLSS